MRAYSKLYLNKARVALAKSFESAVYNFDYSLDEYFNLFLQSDVSKSFEKGDPSFVVGKSGMEIVFDVTNNLHIKNKKVLLKRTKEYWVGYSLAYYQWYTGLSFKAINDYININEILKLYNPYHEMDILAFVDKMSELYKERKKETNLKIYRNRMGISQNELAKLTDIPIRTIQQYEQRQKNINKAQADYLLRLSNALFCNMEDLIERV